MSRNWWPKSWRFLSTKQPSRKALRPAPYRPYLEVLEDRLVLSNLFTVTSASDSLSATAGDGTLRGEILALNQSTAPGANVIDFNISGSGTHTISLVGALPTITNAVTIDGSSQTGFTGTPLIVLNGSGAGSGANGLMIAAGNSTVKDLAIDNFLGDGIELMTAGNDVLTGNYIGVDATGKTAAPNGFGVYIYSANNTVGGTTTAALNVISGNNFGVAIVGSGASGNAVQGNYIGTDNTGTAKLSNSYGVIVAEGAANNTIGGTAAADLNVLSGNSYAGVQIQDSGSTGNVVDGNYIGTDKTGLVALGNGFGVSIYGSASNIVGAGNALAANIFGVAISSSGASGNVVQGNYIGTDKSGVKALGNAYGVYIENGAANNVVGGTTTAALNVLSGNTFGEVISGSGTSGNVTEGNYIGTDNTGAKALANTYGIVVYSSATNNIIGGTVSAALNVISGNAQQGAYIDGSGTTGNVVEGNYIGTDVTGAKALANTYGVYMADGAVGNTVGGTTAGALNVISGNSYTGVQLASSGTSGNVMEGNYIGTDKTGLVGLGNGGFGVAIIFGASGNVVGGTTTAALNVLSANTYYGVEIIGTGASGNVVEGNYIGTDKSGAKALPNSYGVYIAGGSASNTVGGTVSGAANVLSGNSFGVVVSDSGTTGNVVEGNYIGTDVTGTKAVGNTYGVYVYSSAANNIIGGTVSGARNVISANSGGGVFLTGSGITGNVVEGNNIGTDVSGTVKLGNGDGVFIASSSNTVGGTVSGAANVISGNTYGVVIGGGVSGNVVEGDSIGTDKTGTANLGNTYGVYVSGSFNTVGGTTTGAGNTIAYSGIDGVQVDTGSGNAIRGNSIHDSGNLGIQLTNNGNNNQAAPKLTSAITNGASIAIQGTLTAVPSTIYALDFFASPTANPSGAGEGQQYLGSATVTTNALGKYTFTETFTASVPAGYFVSATATDLNGNTSQFATDVTTTSNNPFIVTNTNDSGTGSLRAAITSANAASGPSTIDFNISGSGVQTIKLASELPTITNAVAIDGSSQPGFAGAPLIVLDGSQDTDPNNGNGLTIAAGNSIVKDLAIDHFPQSAIALETGGDDVLAGNYIGVDSTGAVGAGNNNGVYIGSANNTIGGTTTAARNVISANTGDGVAIENSGTTGNVVEGNYIGTDSTGKVALGNGFGVAISAGAASNTVGGAAAVAPGNVISGNTYGVFIAVSGTTGNVVEGDYIGTDVTGTANLGNTYGVFIFDAATNNVIGGTTTAARNIISANSGGGVYLTGSGVSGNVAEGNYIGTDVTGTIKLGNSNGVVIAGGAANNAVGGTASGAGNVISANTTDGVEITGSGSSDNVVEGNYIGTDLTGTKALGNYNGVAIGSASNTVGGTTAAARNVISANTGGGGVYITGGSGIVVEGNYIGTDFTGTKALGNSTGVVLGSASNTVGGTAPGALNVISGNGEGVKIASTGNAVQGNYIGTDITGTKALANFYGVDISSSNNTVGGTTAAARNVISGNNYTGVTLENNGSGNVVQGNFIGTDKSGAVALGNAHNGVYIDAGDDSNTIGGTASGAGNVISANSYAGVEIISIGTISTTGNVVQGNYIGTDVTGTAHLGNTFGGVYIHGGANNNSVGGTVSGAGNVIVNNGGNGVDVDHSSGDAIRENSIYNSADNYLGISLYVGGNNEQLPPTLTSATTTGSSITIIGSLTTKLQTTFNFDFFASPTLDSSGNAEGQQYLGSATVTSSITSPSIANINVTFNVSVPAGYYITATATDPNGNTSPFSGGVTAVA